MPRMSMRSDLAELAEVGDRFRSVLPDPERVGVVMDDIHDAIVGFRRASDGVRVAAYVLAVCFVVATVIEAFRGP